ncbi:MAG TPA: hypothetical protein VM487_09735 [Phycisphaerae bacterium]|nr:hypothetical protein [Phycisphaerae bacterium]
MLSIFSSLMTKPVLWRGKRKLDRSRRTFPVRSESRSLGQLASVQHVAQRRGRALDRLSGAHSDQVEVWASAADEKARPKPTIEIIG